MIHAHKNPHITRWFQSYTQSYLRRSFHRVLALGEAPVLPEGPMLVCMNHSSWWDMLLAFWLAHDVLGTDGYGPMDERQLQRYAILRRIGVFGVDRESLQGGRDFLEYSRRLLEGQSRSLWITAQGAMVSTQERPIRFYSGVARLAQAIGGCHVTTVALDYQFWDEKRPEAFVSFGPVRWVETGAGFSKRELLGSLEEQMTGQLDALQTAIRSRDAVRFQPLLSGRGGVSPAYDTIRRLGGGLKGEAPPVAHGDVASPPRWGPARRVR